MSLRIRRGLATDRTSITPLEGEFIYTTDTKVVYIGDGTTAGGNALTQDYLQIANAAAIYQTIATERAALANTNASIATQENRVTLVNTNLTGTNTALRTLISDRLQVANAATIYQTKAVERAALANTNASIATQATRVTLVNTNLTGTNTALRTLISDRLQVANAAAIYQTKSIERAALANTNASIATQASRITLVNTNLTGTNTALRTLISDRLQVANAATIYQTKSVERAALANTNASIATQATRVTLVNTNLTGTNTALRTLINDRLQVANAATIYATKSNPATSGLLAHTGRATISTNLDVTGNTSVGGNLIITGDLTINGTTTTINATTVTVDDKNIELGSVAVPTNTTADGGGITLKGTTDKTINWVNATQAWTFSEHINLASGKTLYLNGTDFQSTYATNTYVKTTLANTNSRVTLVNTNLTGTNTALRTLISDRLQVANAATIYQTKSIERAALANTNASIATQAGRITLVNTNLTGTNTALRTLTNARLQVSNSFSSLTVRAANTAAVTTISSDVKLNDAIVVNPAGHLQVIINGVTYKIPYFL